ncbi:kinesin light chain 1 [Colletotrichum incanum]|uniref:Kinesin light chain 1 n=1 Tax=Colletotrichum incanum TaxID=1573173 RepID=A0A161VQ20_COLIC|nr:kinesin light chain 1 [Colletotrichum incanum]
MAYPFRRREDFQVAIICALPLEYDAVALTFDEFWDENRDQQRNAPGDYNMYRTGRIGSHNVVLLLLSNMGKVSAASATANLRSTYAGIKLAILTGICGGVPSPWTANELLLGDVVISKSMVQYDLGRQYPNDFATKTNVEEILGRPSRDIRSLIATFETRQGRSDLQRQTSRVLMQLQQKATDYGERSLYQRPPLTADFLFEPGYLHRHRDSQNCNCSDSGACEIARSTSCEKLQCDGGRVVSRKRLKAEHPGDDAVTAEGPQVFVGRVGSGDTVMKSGLDRDRVAAQHSLIAFEMEGAGVWDEIPSVVVKGVCDYADSHKNKNWQNFAAATAASTTKALLEYHIQTQRPTATRTWFLVPYTQNHDFIGRSGILDHVKQLFGHKQPQQPAARARSRVALHGLGGIGKTQIALAYAYWLKGACPDMSVFWVHASNSERFRQAYFSIAQECKIPGHDDPKADVLTLVKAWLEKKNRGRWVMILDNADDTEVFFPTQAEQGSALLHKESREASYMGCYVPECDHGSILITSRNTQAALRLTRGKRPVSVTTMTDDEANQLFCAAFEDETISIEETTKLSSRLEHLPLALAQAAAFIQENDIPISTYVQLLDESDSVLVDQLSQPFETTGRDPEIPHAVTATWIVSFEQIKRRHSLASNVLSLISLFDRQAIPEEFVTNYYNMSQPEKPQTNATAEVLKSLGTLVAFSFITKATDGTFDMHRLIQLVMRKWLVTERRLIEFAEQALRVVSIVYPYGEYENREICSMYLPHAQAVLDHDGVDSEVANVAKASILHNIGGFLSYQGKWIAAEQHVVQAVELHVTALGGEHPNTLTSIANLASTYWNQGRWKEAEELEVQVVEVSKRVLGEEHPGTLTSISNLASTYRIQGRLAEAEELEIQVMEISKRVLGEEHPDTLRSIDNVASTYRIQGRWTEAEELGVQVVEIRKRVLGEEHPNTLISIANLALTYLDQDRWTEAEELGVQVVEIRKRVLGEEHPGTLTSISNLASTYRIQGRWKEAEELGVQVVEISKRVLREEHPDTLISIANLALTYLDQDRWTEAEELGVQVVEISKRVLGEEHPDTLTRISNLASTYRKQGRWKEAEELGVQVMEISKRVLGEEHPGTLTSISNLASTYWKQGRWTEAEELEVQVMEISKRVLGEEHPGTLTSISNLASTYWKQGRWTEAEELEVQVMEISKRVLGEEHPGTLTSISNLASTYWKQGRWTEAEELEVQVMEISKRVLGEEHPGTLTSISNLASTYWKQGRWTEAEELGVQVVEISKRVLGEEHPDTIISMHNLAYTWKDQGRWEAAIQLMRDCLSLRQHFLGLDHPDTMSSCSALADWEEDLAKRNEVLLVEGGEGAGNADRC